MGEKIGTILLMVGVVVLFVVLFAGKIAPAVDGKGDDVITEIDGSSTTTIAP
jgi:hypothetical protein